MERNHVDRIAFVIETMEALKQEQELAEHKLLFADAMLAAKDGIRVGDLAIVLKQNGVEIGEHRLYDWLRRNGYVCRMECGTNRPTQKSMELGVMELKRTAMINGYGKVRMTYIIRVTPKGQAYFINKIMTEKDSINALATEKKAARKKAI